MREGGLALDPGLAPGICGQLGMLAQQVSEAVNDRLPALGEKRLLVPEHVDERLLDRHDRPAPRGAQEEVVILSVAAGNLLVQQSDVGQRVPLHDKRGKNELGEALAH